MKCNVCGYELNDGLGFCPNCGTSIVRKDNDNSNKFNNIKDDICRNKLLKAREVYNSGNYVEAKELYDEILINNKKSLEASLFSSLSLFQNAFLLKDMNEMKFANKELHEKIIYFNHNIDFDNKDNEYVLSEFAKELIKIKEYKVQGKTAIEPIMFFEYINSIYIINKRINEKYLNRIIVDMCDSLNKNNYELFKFPEYFDGRALKDVYNDASRFV